MRKLTLLTGALLVTVLALAGGLSLPQPAAAICICETYNDTSTAINWGKGSDCTAAHSQLVSLLNQEAFATCGGITATCLGEIVYTSNPQCFWNGMMWQEDGYRNFSCKVCGPITP